MCTSRRITTGISNLLQGNFSRISGNLGLKTTLLVVVFLCRSSSSVPVWCLKASKQLGGFPRSRSRICHRNRKMRRKATATFAWTSARRERLRLSYPASTHSTASVSKAGSKITSSVRCVAQKLSPSQKPRIKTNLHSPKIWISTHMETKACPSHSSRDSCDLGNQTHLTSWELPILETFLTKSNVELTPLNNWP